MRPAQSEFVPLATFLNDPLDPLSHRAASGFLSRARTGKLRFADGFLDDLERYIDDISEDRTYHASTRRLTATRATPSPQTRRRMKAVRQRDTAPEIRLRSALHALGMRFRVDARPLPGSRRRADVVFPGLGSPSTWTAAFGTAVPSTERFRRRTPSGGRRSSTPTSPAIERPTRSSRPLGGWRFASGGTRTRERRLVASGGCTSGGSASQRRPPATRANGASQASDRSVDGGG